MPRPRAVILHISDIHRTPDEPVTNDQILQYLQADLERHDKEGIPKPSLVVVSGDITQSGELTEFDEARQLLERLLEYLQLSKTALILVPGNHDVHWPTSRDAFVYYDTLPSGPSDRVVIQLREGVLVAKSEEAYQARWNNYARFYKDLFGLSCSTVRGSQFTTHVFTEFGLSIAGFNSCDLNDHRRFHGSIHDSSISQAADALTSNKGLKFAVWHHDLDWYGEGRADSLKTDSLRALSQRVFHLGLCGHSHRPASHDALTVDGYPLKIVAAGSLCAGPRQRVESAARSYNILEVYDTFVRLRSRSKETVGRPWKCSPFVDANGKACEFQDIHLIGAASTQSVAPIASISPQVRISSPFTAMNAKDEKREEVLSQYVWTSLSDHLDSGTPQVVLGTRGSGKTSLLLTLTVDGRRASPRVAKGNAALTDRIGLLVPMRVTDVTSFNSKGYIPLDERKTLFRSLIATFWAQEFINTLAQCILDSRLAAVGVPTERQAARLFARLWARSAVRSPTFSGLRLWLKKCRAEIARAIGQVEFSGREQVLTTCRGHELLRGGTGPIADIADELKAWPAFATTQWTVLFDEVENLNDWQQQEVYEYLGSCSSSVTVKLTTLPYAHTLALQGGAQVLVEGQDYRELTLALTARLELDSSISDEISQDFLDVAEGLWRARLSHFGAAHISVREIWPTYTFEQAVAESLGANAPTRLDLEDQMIGDLSPDTQPRARELRRQDPRQFSNQYWRKLQQPFRFRFAQRQPTGVDIPLYYGWKSLIRACEGNCRWFLLLADICWERYWKRGGFRPLSASEQHRAVRAWARNIVGSCRQLPRLGEELDDLLGNVAAEMRRRLTASPYLYEERLQVEALVTQRQVHAIALGVAYGLLVPTLTDAKDLLTMKYPTINVGMRVGFPVAVEAMLPLRTGSIMTIGDLRQVVFPWWRE